MIFGILWKDTVSFGSIMLNLYLQSTLPTCLQYLARLPLHCNPIPNGTLVLRKLCGWVGQVLICGLYASVQHCWLIRLPLLKITHGGGPRLPPGLSCVAETCLDDSTGLLWAKFSLVRFLVQHP